MIRRLAMASLRRRVRTGLDGVHVDGLSVLKQHTAAGPVVVACTHQSWWDGWVALWLCSELALTPTVLMDAENLKTYPFFELVGVAGVKGTRGVRDALARLEGPGDVLWIFPQGGYAMPALRPLELQRGAVWLAAKAGCPVLPVALGYMHAEQPSVRAFVSIQDPVEADRDRLAAGMARGLDAIAHRSASFEPLLPGLPIQVGWGTSIAAWMWRATSWMR